MSRYKSVIGRFEYTDIVNGLEGVPAKIDTGAHRSSIHTKSVKEVTTKQGKPGLKFTLVGHPVYKATKTFTTSNFRKLPVRSSNGHVTERYEVRLKIRLGYKVFSTPFTLADRSKNVFPVLIGRKALNNRFLIDPSLAAIDRKELRKAINNLPIDEEDIDEMEGINV